MAAPRIDAISHDDQGVYRSLDVEIDPGCATVLRRGREVALRAKAFLVLLYLLQQRHRVVSKEELFDRIWPDTSVTDATLAGCIQEVRKALGDDAKVPRFIKTLPKLGYRFVAPVAEVEAGAPATDRPSVAETVPAPKWRWTRAVVAGLSVALLAVAFWLIVRAKTTPVPTKAEFGEAAWWKLNEGGGNVISDTSGHGLTGKVTGGRWEPGILGRALLLDGVNDRVEGVDDRGLLPRGSSARSLSAWVKTISGNGDTTAIVFFGTPSVRGSFRLLLLPNGRPAFANDAYAGFGDDRSMAMSSKRVDDGRWHQLAGTYAERRAVLFVDGVQESVVTMHPESRTPAVPQTSWVIGNGFEKHTGFRGAVDDVRIWPRALKTCEVAALYRCSINAGDVAIPGRGSYFYLPVMDSQANQPLTLAFAERGNQADASTSIVHTGNDYAGVQLAVRNGDCSTVSLRGADIGQDLLVSVDLLAPANKEGFDTQAGPYFRSRRAGPGDGVIGPVSAGYWVLLHSTGIVTVKCLNPSRTVAFTKAAEGFDSSVFHRLEAAVQGETLEVALDGHRLTFDQSGQPTRTVQIPPAWEGPPRIGHNEGTAGVAFASEPIRYKAGGQQARHLSIQAYQPLPEK
jgi:DNA-binding winged helix-turn-helix (wHTH) protein